MTACAGSSSSSEKTLFVSYPQSSIMFFPSTSHLLHYIPYCCAVIYATGGPSYFIKLPIASTTTWTFEVKPSRDLPITWNRCLLFAPAPCLRTQMMEASIMTLLHPVQWPVLRASDRAGSLVPSGGTAYTRNATVHNSQLGPRADHPKHRIQHLAVILCRTYAVCLSLRWQEIFKLFHFLEQISYRLLI